MNVAVATDTASASLPPPQTPTADEATLDGCISDPEDYVNSVEIEDDKAEGGNEIDDEDDEMLCKRKLSEFAVDLRPS